VLASSNAADGSAEAAGEPCCRFLVYYDAPEALVSNGCICLVDQRYSVSLPKHERTGHPFGIRIDLQVGHFSLSLFRMCQIRLQFTLTCTSTRTVPNVL
jgi:hypothetical protein